MMMTTMIIRRVDWQCDTYWSVIILAPVSYICVVYSSLFTEMVERNNNNTKNNKKWKKNKS